MSIDFLTEYFTPVIAGICLCVGFLIRGATDRLDRYVPCIVAALGLCLAGWQAYLTGSPITPAVILEGLFSGLASTGLYEAFKQLIGGR